MADRFNISTLPYGWLIATVIIAASFGAFGYIIATRRVKQPVVVFLARFGIVFFLLWFVEFAVLYQLPSFHATMQNITARFVGGILTLAGVNHSLSQVQSSHCKIRTLPLMSPLPVWAASSFGHIQPWYWLKQAQVTGSAYWVS